MAKDSQPVSRLPIKVVLPRQGKERKISGGGSEPKPLRPVDDKLRTHLATEVKAIQQLASAKESTVGSIPVRVKLISKASAKSHRPDALFGPTCPIIGAGKLGELFVKGTRQGLDRLAKALESNQSKQITKDISTVSTIEPVTPSYRRGGLSAVDILKQSPKLNKGFATRVRLFDYGSDDDQAKLVRDFLGVCENRKLQFSASGYSERSFVYAVECKSTEDVETVSSIVGVRSVSRMPVVRMIRPRTMHEAALPKGLPEPRDGEDPPVVVVVDSGVTSSIGELNKWIIGRHSDVAPSYRNDEHGTFVAGLVAFGGQLNPNLQCISDSPCAVFDLQVMPNDDPKKGDVDSLTEQELLQSLEAALKLYSNKYRVWNISLGTDDLCSPDEFSSFAGELDNLQEKYQVVFVISAGNVTSPPLLDYPRIGSQLASGRITSPADSVLGMTVGAVSHIDYAKNGPKLNHPSAFSRHGAGPNYIIKPDLVHYGGTCSLDRSHQVGIRSLVKGGTAEDMGTSFSAPLVARSLAQVFNSLTPMPSPVLGRALLTHHARDPRSGGRVPDGEENFFGFGMPAPPPYCLECTPYSSTLVFEDTLRPGYFLEWDAFPYPPSLYRRGKYYGEIWMTVAFAPTRGPRWGTEYCESHIDAHFGVYFEQTNRKTGEINTKFRGLVPPEHKNPGLLYESYQVEKLRKWAPVRTYHGTLEKGERGSRWRLKVQLLTRHGIEELDSFRAQPFALIVTIADPSKKVAVYDEMAQLIRPRFQAENLTVRAATQIRARGRN